MVLFDRPGVHNANMVNATLERVNDCGGTNGDMSEKLLQHPQQYVRQTWCKYQET